MSRKTPLNTIKRSPRKKHLRSGSSDLDDFREFFSGGGRDREIVTPTIAMGIVAYFSAIRNLSQDIAAMAGGVYESTNTGRKEIRDHPVNDIFNLRANTRDDSTSYCNREALQAHALGYHGGFAEIERTAGGQPIGLFLLDPTSVTVAKNKIDGSTIYIVGPNKIVFQPSDIFHIHGLGYDGLTGYILSSLFKTALGAAISTQKHRASFFKNAATMTGVLQVPGSLEESAFAHLRESFNARHSGDENAYRPLILEEGMVWNSISPDPQKSQLVESAYLDVENCARMFRMPPHKLQHTNHGGAAYASVYEANIDYGTDTLTPWIVQWEQEINNKLLRAKSGKSKLYFRFNMDSRLRADPEKRAMAMNTRFNMAQLTPNEGRALEELNPSQDPAADMLYVNSATIPLSLLVDKIKAEFLEKTTQTDINPSRGKGNTGNSAYKKAFESVSVLFRDFFKFQLRIEHDRAIRALKSNTLNFWSTMFYSDARGEIHNRIKPILDICLLVLNISDSNRSILESYVVDMHIKRSIADINRCVDKSLLEYWLTSRFDQQTEEVMQYISTLVED